MKFRRHIDNKPKRVSQDLGTAFGYIDQSIAGKETNSSRLFTRPMLLRLVSPMMTLQTLANAAQDSVTLEEIESVAGFVQNIDNLELPNQLVAVLADPLLQKLLLLRPSDESHQRIANWLNSILQDVIDGDADEATLFDILDILRDFVVSTKVRITAIQGTLR